MPLERVHLTLITVSQVMSGQVFHVYEPFHSATDLIDQKKTQIMDISRIQTKKKINVFKVFFQVFQCKLNLVLLGKLGEEHLNF